MVVLSFSFVLGCTWETKLPDDVTGIEIDREREMIVADDAVLEPLSRNGTNAPLSFRRATERLGLSEGATLRWLEAWSERLIADGRADRARVLDERVTCPWLRAKPTNACDATCASCKEHVLLLDRAPFRLIAIANRTDLAVMPDRAGGGGEGRLVFALTDGAADDGAGTLPFAVIYEYAQEGSALDWAKKWHALAETQPASGERPLSFSDQLVEVTNAFVDRGTLAQIRTADALTGPMLLHQFVRDGDAIVSANVRNSPAWTRVEEREVRGFVAANASAIEAGTAVLPRSWWATESSPSDTAPSYAEPLFSQTCGGCHKRSPSAFQIDPMAKGAAKLSPFLRDEELPRRKEALQLILSSRVTL